MTKNNIENSQIAFITEIKQKIRSAQYEALKAVNTYLIELYWEIGKQISEKQAENWGKAIVPTLSQELQKEFPGIKGFSVANLWFMAKFYTEYSQIQFMQPLVTQITQNGKDEILQPVVRELEKPLIPSIIKEISWTKHIVILSKCKDNLQRQFYINMTKKFGWTKNVLINQIENKFYEKYLLNQTNFSKTLPEKISEQAILAVKDEYIFDFLDLSNNHSERELENELVKNIRGFLLEMGGNFTFLGNQYRVEINDKEYFIDLLLYHRKLQCLVAVELKIGEFLPEYKGKMEFYLSILNDKVKLPMENDSIGIIICKEKDRTIVEYSLKTSNMPIGVATYNTSQNLPEEYKNLLPDTSDIENKLKGILEI